MRRSMIKMIMLQHYSHYKLLGRSKYYLSKRGVTCATTTYFDPHTARSAAK